MMNQREIREWELSKFNKEELISMYLNIYDAQVQAENRIDFLEMARESLEEEVRQLKRKDYRDVLQDIDMTLKEIKNVLKRG